VISTAETARSPRLQVELGGQAIRQAEEVSLGFATVIGLLAAIVVLLLTFGSVIAMGAADRHRAARAGHRHRAHRRRLPPDRHAPMPPANWRR
jgi:hypothetical protein